MWNPFRILSPRLLASLLLCIVIYVALPSYREDLGGKSFSKTSSKVSDIQHQLRSFYMTQTEQGTDESDSNRNMHPANTTEGPLDLDVEIDEDMNEMFAKFPGVEDDEEDYVTITEDPETADAAVITSGEGHGNKQAEYGTGQDSGKQLVDIKEDNKQNVVQTESLNDVLFKGNGTDQGQLVQHNSGNRSTQQNRTNDNSPLNNNFANKNQGGSSTGNAVDGSNVTSEHPQKVDPQINPRENSSTNIKPTDTGVKRAGEPNPYPFNYILNNEKLCEGLTHLKYIVYVYSAPKRADRRQIIRDTWAQPDLFPKWPSRTIFIVGKPDLERVQKNLYKEAEKYGDIIQKDFMDTYANLTYKGIIALEWITDYCNIADFTIKTDDDMYVNIFRMLHFVERQVKDKKKYVAGLVHKEKDIPRDQSLCTKWCVRETELPGRERYPTYCAGAAYIFDGSMIAALHNATLYVPFFWIEDIYFTGLLLEEIPGVEYLNIGSYLVEMYNLREMFHPTKWVAGEYRSPWWLKHAWACNIRHLSEREIEWVGQEKYRTLLYKSDGRQCP